MQTGWDGTSDDFALQLQPFNLQFSKVFYSHFKIMNVLTSDCGCLKPRKFSHVSFNFYLSALMPSNVRLASSLFIPQHLVPEEKKLRQKLGLNSCSAKGMVMDCNRGFA